MRTPSLRTTRSRTALCLSLGLVACGKDAQRQTPLLDAAPPPVDATVDDADRGVDVGPPPDGVAPPDTTPSVDAVPPADVGPTDDAGPPPDAGPDAAPGPPEVCDGLDDDADGRIDEGASNACGGCGPLPPEGCQAWVIQLVQGEDGLLDPNRLIGLQGAAVASSVRDIEGARCESVRIPAQHPDAHLGLVNIDAPGAMLVQVPAYDERLGSHRYSNNPELGSTHLFDAGDDLTIRAGGGRAVAGFELNLTGPAGPAPLDSAALEPLLDLARGERAAGVSLAWTASDDGATARLFVGGSVPVFNRGVYRAIRSYQLDAVLEDDGRADLDAELFGQTVPESAVRAVFTRERSVRRNLGPHVIEATAGQGAQAVRRGSLERDDAAPFDILEPDPDVRRIQPGEPLVVRWSALPPGVGPLSITLVTNDQVNRERRVVSCTVRDAASGQLTLPADYTQIWPAGPADTRQLTLSWDLSRTRLQAPDRGEMTHSVAVIEQLEP